ncbi:MAG: V-type ATPase subunit [Oscillospiraceae bacterium]|nr:V-type ATPase subunit [Oscillospiraceae bacterium]
MEKHRDIDFLFLSALVKGKENNLLTREQLERMISAPELREAARVLEDAGYGRVKLDDPYQLDAAIIARQTEIFHEITIRSPAPEIVDVFHIPYDYHNAKVLVKAELADEDGEHLMSDNGRVHHSVFAEVFHDGPLVSMPPVLAKATLEAKELLQTTGDAQAMDLLLDRAMYQEYLTLADSLGDTFFTSYVRLLIDTVNLRTIVRGRRMELGRERLSESFIAGGKRSLRRMKDAVAKDTRLDILYAATPLEQAAIAGQAAMTGGSLMAFERMAAGAVSAYLEQSRHVAFGIAPIIAYMAAIEREGQAIRTIAAGRAAELNPTEIRERIGS